MTGTARQELLNHISSLATDADAVDSASKVFLPLDTHRLALRPSVVVIEGSRGAGKTALFHLVNELGTEIGSYLQDPSIPEALWVDGFSDHVHHPAPSVLDQLVASTSSSSDASLRAFWAIHLLTRLKASGINAAQLPPPLEQAYQSSPHDISKWIPFGETNIASVMSCLDAVDAWLTKTGKLVFASYDHLDRLGLLESTRNTRQRLVRALVALWLSLSTRYRSLRGKIFLRPDLFEEAERSFADASKLRPRSVSLEWDTGSLYRLVARHLANRGPHMDLMHEWLKSAGIELQTHPGGPEFGIMPSAFSERIQKQFAKKLAGEVMGKGPKKGYTYRWIPARLKDAGGRIVPRSFLRLFAHAAKEALRDPPGRGPLMAPGHLVAALKATSNDRVNELREEYPFVGRLENLRGQTMLMKKGAIIDLLGKKTKDDDGFGNDGESVFEELLRVGVLEVRDDGRIDVPDIYRYGHGIKRKGGAAAPR